MKPALPDGHRHRESSRYRRGMRSSHIASDVRKWAQRENETRRRLSEARNDLERDQEALERRLRNEGIVAPGAVEEARGYRDTLWGLLKARYIACSEISAEEVQALC